jgi:hypothetical protein
MFSFNDKLFLRSLLFAWTIAAHTSCEPKCCPTAVYCGPMRSRPFATGWGIAFIAMGGAFDSSEIHSLVSPDQIKSLIS